MNAADIEQLLYEEESASLDFKRDQYLFAGASDEQKSEILKDILGFANAFRRSDAFILIGVEDVRGGKGNVYGVSNHLDDHSLQQFVNAKTNRPIKFHYEACELAGMQVGIVCIDRDQNRPIFLRENYGKLKKNEVYIRRGTSTDPTTPALPDEVAHMGVIQHAGPQKAELTVEFAAIDRDSPLGARVDWSAELCEMPDIVEIPRLVSGKSSNPLGIDLSILTYGLHEELNSNFYRETANYEFFRRLFRKVRLVITNVGQIAATDVRVEIEIPEGNGIGVSDPTDVPETPKRVESRYFATNKALTNIRPAFRSVGDVNIDKNDDRFKVEVECGNLQPGRRVWSDAFFVCVVPSGLHEIFGHLYAANIPAPEQFRLEIDAKIAETKMSVKAICELADQLDDEE